MPKAYIGTSGYIYDHWYGIFYPEDLVKAQWLEYYCRFFDTVELNVTFYRLPFETAFKNWYKRTPDNFSFTVKGSRFITHVKKLTDCEEPLKLLFARAKYLKEKLGVVLWQTPPTLAYGEIKSKIQSKIQKFTKFCELLKQFTPKNIRHSFEFRHESWFCPEVYQILKKYNFALVICDYPFEIVSSEQEPAVRGRKQIVIPETADFIYLRRHGATALYSSNYSDAQLQQDAELIKKWLKNGKDVYVYFNNDARGYAVKNALKLKELLKK